MKFDLNTIRLYEWGDLFLVKMQTEIGFDGILKIIDNLETSLESSKTELKKEISENLDLKQLEGQDREAYHQHLYEMDEITLREIETLQRYSMVLSIFSFLEGILKSLCEGIEEELKFTIRLKDLNNNEDLQWYWNYLTKVLIIDTKKIEPDFTVLKQQKIVRNIIAHQSGYANDSQVNKIQEVSGLKTRYNKVDIHNSDYLIFLVKTMQSLFDNLIIAVDDRFKEIKSSNAT